LILCFLAFIAFPVSHVLAQGPTSLPGSVKIAQTDRASWTIQADKLLYDQEKNLYEAEGNVRISSKDRMIQADYATVNNQTRQADLSGKVTVQYGNNWVKGEHIIWNLDTETGWVDSGVLYFSENNFFIQGESISKLSASEYDLKKGFVTSCNPADPAWKIQFNEMKVTVGGTAWTRDASFWARSWPVVYWPWLGIPVETQRQSGFLLPVAGNSGLNGFQAEVPYFWAIRPDMDATFYTNYLQNRGVMGGFEYRVNNPEWGKGVWSFNFLDDQASRSFLAGQGYPYQTEDRYWIRGKHDIELPWNIDAKVDVDYVSDRNFLQEFTVGSSSYWNSNSVFGQYFGRNILYDWTSLVRESSVYLEKKWESQLLSMDTRYWENLESSVAPETTQKLPGLSFTSIPKWIDDTSFYYTLQSSAVNYWRSQGDTEQRLDAYPRIYYPMHWGNYLDIEPSAGLRGSAYTIQWQNSGSDDMVERIVPDAAVEMSTRVNREFPVNFLNFTALQHAIRPEVSYEYANQSMTSAVPQLDQLDLDQSRNGVRYGFTTFLIGKEMLPDASGELIPTYRELARFRVFQFYNVQPPPVEDPLFDTNNVMRQGFSPVGFRLDISPKKSVTVSYDLDLDLSSAGQGKAQNLFMTLDSGTGYILRFDYEDIPNLSVDEISAATLIKVYNDIYINTFHDYSLLTGLGFSQGYGFRYVHGCWGVGVGYERVGNDNRFVYTVDLLGIGSVGSQSSFFGRPLFGESRAGYQHPESWILSR
jgi:LPS-assembly protein